MQTFEIMHAAYLALAVFLEIIANIALKISDGFRKRRYGIFSILCVLGTFSGLTQAVKAIDLSVAYAFWGGFGLVATVAAGWLLFGQRLSDKGLTGLLLLLIGMAILKLA